MCAEPYIGVDAQIRHMDYNKRYGRNIFQDDLPQGNIYVGLKLNNYMALEGGFETTLGKSRTTSLTSGTNYLGTFLDDPPQIIVSRVRIKGPHFDLVGIYDICGEYRLQLIGAVGIAYLKTIQESWIVADSLGPIDSETGRRTFRKRKSVLRLTTGLQHMINNCTGVRAIIGWENTRKLGDLGAPIENSISILRVQLKDSINYGAGVFVMF